MSNVSSPGSWVDDMSAVLNKVPQLSNGSPGGVSGATTESLPANGSAGEASAGLAEPATPTPPGAAAADEDAAPTPSVDSPAAASEQTAAAPAAPAADTAAEASTEQSVEPSATESTEQPVEPAATAAAAPDAAKEPALATEAPAPDTQAEPAAAPPDGGEADSEGFSTPVKAQQPASAASLEAPAAVRSLTGVAEGFQDPSSAAPKPKQTAADVVAASLAEAAPAPADEKDFGTFQEAVGEELQLAKAASDAAKAMGSPGAADDILAQMSGSRPGTPDPAAIPAATGEAADGAAKGVSSAEEPEDEPAAAATDTAVPDATAAGAAEAGGPSDAAAEAPAPAEAAAGAGPALAEAGPSADGDTPPAAEPAAADAKAPEPATDEAQPPAPGDGDPETAAGAAAAASPAPEPPAEQPEQEPSSPAATSSAAAPAAPATPDAAPTANGTVESPSTPEPLRTPSSITARIAALKTSPRCSIPRPSPTASPTRRWSVNTPKSPNGPPASGEVVAETVKPKEELKSFWEAHSPADGGLPISPPRRSTAENSNAGRKWQVKLNMPLASGKVSDLSYYRPKAASPPPPPPEYKHKIGEATFPLDELKGMNADHGIDPANKELYLADEEFQTSFEMDKDAFKGKPKWRQVLLKKKVGLF